MKTIWKFELVTTDYQTLRIPVEAKFLCVQVQDEVPCIWVVVDPSNPVEEYNFRIFGTGHIFDIEMESSQYIGTYQLSNGSLVFHVFLVK